jgi:cardiolipin synthase
MFSLAGVTHVLLNKRDPRGATGWIVVCLAFPFIGVAAYWVLGNNRIQTRAKKLQLSGQEQLTLPGAEAQDEGRQEGKEPSVLPEYRNLADLSWAVSKQALVNDNQVTALFNGERAYPRMIEAIEGASASVYLATYIFETSEIGEEFIQALSRAVERGVNVRVLVDGVGEKYSFPWVTSRLRKLGVPVAKYLPPRLLPPSLRINLRNHRKILAVDGEVAFTGGMNIRAKQVAREGRRRIFDIHFELRGKVVAQLEQVFINDWKFATREDIAPSPVTTAIQSATLSRVIADGPDEDMDKLTWILVGAISLARHSIKIMTPYFLPSAELSIALKTAALRGVDVSIILPENNNLVFMKWASNHVVGALVETGINIYFVEGPFVHSKLFMVDDYYVQIGSSNLDPRSLRLNFEVAVEVYDTLFASGLSEHFADNVARSRCLTLEAVRKRGVGGRLRDAFFWLFSPYL